MKNLSKRKRYKALKEQPKYQYRDSDNHVNDYNLERFKKLSLKDMESRLQFLKVTRKDAKLLLSKCQKLIDLKKKLP